MRGAAVQSSSRPGISTAILTDELEETQSKKLYNVYNEVKYVLRNPPRIDVEMRLPQNMRMQTCLLESFHSRCPPLTMQCKIVCTRKSQTLPSFHSPARYCVHILLILFNCPAVNRE